jgi:hypothetical protein
MASKSTNTTHYGEANKEEREDAKETHEHTDSSLALTSEQSKKRVQVAHSWHSQTQYPIPVFPQHRTGMGIEFGRLVLLPTNSPAADCV